MDIPRLGVMRCAMLAFAGASIGFAQPQDPVEGIVRLFDTYRIVMLGEIHGSRQQWDLIRKLVAAPGFAERVNDIVLEFGNAHYQDVVDRYIGGENVPMEQVQKAWRDPVGVVGPVSPLYGEFYATVRAVNRKLPSRHGLRILCGDPPLDWSKVQARDDLAFSLPFRDLHYSSVVRYEVLGKKRKALLIMGSGHFRRNLGRPGAIEAELLMALVKPYVVMPGSNLVGGYDDLDPRFDQWPAPWLGDMKGSWFGSLPNAGPRGGAPAGTWEQTAEAYLYLGPRDKMTVVKNRRSDLDGTPYGNEIKRRLTLFFDKPPEFLPKSEDREQPAFSRNPAPPAALPAIPKPRP